MAFLDTLGTLLALALRANLLDEKGNLPEIEKPMMADAISTVFASLLGTTTTGAYIESATGIAAGGKSGLTALVVAVLFLSALFFAPFLSSIPAFAYGPSLIIVMMSFTYNIGIGMTAGFLVYPLFKILGGKREEIKAGLWVLALLSLLFFVFYPY